MDFPDILSGRQIRFDVFGSEMVVVREGGRWGLFYDSATGVLPRVQNVVIPDDLREDELGIFLDDIFHENANALHPGVKRKN